MHHQSFSKISHLDIHLLLKIRIDEKIHVLQHQLYVRDYFYYPTVWNFHAPSPQARNIISIGFSESVQNI